MVKLPAELLDIILGLVKHSDSLQTCILSSSYIALLAEKHLYGKIKLRASKADPKPEDMLQVSISELNDILKKNPRIGGLIQSIHMTHDVYVGGDSTIPHLPSLVAVSIGPKLLNPIGWSSVNEIVCTLWEKLVCLPTIEEVEILGILPVPLQILDQCRGIRRLALDDLLNHSSCRQRTPPPFASSLQHLTFYNSDRYNSYKSFEEVFAWLTHGSALLNLQSVHLKWNINTDALAKVMNYLTQQSCSSTLKELRFTLRATSKYKVPEASIQTAADGKTSNSAFYKPCMLLDIPAFPGLSKIVIKTIIQCHAEFRLGEESRSYYSALPEIGSFLQTVHTEALREVEICLIVKGKGCFPPTLAEVDFSPIAQLYATSFEDAFTSTNSRQFPPIDLTFRERPYCYFDSRAFQSVLYDLQKNHVVGRLMREKKVFVHGPLRGFVDR